MVILVWKSRQRKIGCFFRLSALESLLEYFNLKNKVLLEADPVSGRKQLEGQMINEDLINDILSEITQLQANAKRSSTFYNDINSGIEIISLNKINDDLSELLVREELTYNLNTAKGPIDSISIYDRKITLSYLKNAWRVISDEVISQIGQDEDFSDEENFIESTNILFKPLIIDIDEDGNILTEYDRIVRPVVNANF